MNTQIKRLGLMVMLSVAIPASAFAQAENDALVQRMNEINAQLRGTQLNVAIEQI